MNTYITIADFTRHWKEKLSPELKAGNIVIVKDGRSNECLFEIHSYNKKRYSVIQKYGEPLDFNDSSTEISDEDLMQQLRGEEF